jgi:hypothetical protein
MYIYIYEAKLIFEQLNVTVRIGSQLLMNCSVEIQAHSHGSYVHMVHGRNATY